MPGAPRLIPHARARIALACASLLAFALACAGAATGASSTVVVTVDVPSTTSLVTTGCAPNTPNITDFGQVMPGSTAKTTADCGVTFGSTNDSASLRMTQSDGAGSAMGRPVDTWTRHSGSSTRMDSIDSSGAVGWIALTNGGVRRSLDSGATWESTIFVGGGNHDEIAVTSAAVAWLAGDNTNTVYRTTNGNAGTPTWSATATAPGFNVRAMAAASTTHAWVAGLGGTIKATTDGGSTWTTRTWTDQPGGPGASNNEFAGMSAYDTDSALAFGPAGRIVATSDGTTWRDISLPVSMNVLDVYMHSDTTLVAVGEAGRIYTTSTATNATPTWTQRTTGTELEINDVQFVDPSTGIAVGDRGLMLTTSDGGVTWTRGDIDTSLTGSSITAFGSNTWVTVTPGASVVRTTNDGVDWTFAVSGLSVAFDVSMVTDGRGWRVGNDGIIERTTNGGVTWSTQTSGTTQDLFSVHAFDTQRVIAVGRNGTVVTTSDGGTTWITRSSGTSEELTSIDALASGTGWAVGLGGVILRTSDFGASWVVQSTNAGSNLRAVVARSQTSAIAMGGYGTAWRTTDGSTWATFTSAHPTTNVRAMTIDRPSGHVFYQAGSSVARSTDGGATWTVRGSLTNTPRGMDAVSATRIVSVSYGVISVSNDAGATWSNMTGNQVAYHWLNAIDGVDRNTNVAVGNGAVAGTTGSSDDVANYQQNVSDWIGDGTEAFGVCLRATTATPTWSVNATCDQTADGAHWRAVPTASDLTAEVARTIAGDGDRTASFRFGLRVDPAQPPGELSAGITFMVVAPGA